MRKLFCYLCILLTCITGCNDEEIELELDPNVLEVTNIRYVVTMDQPDLFYLSLSYTDGESYYDFTQKQYVNRDSLKKESTLDISYWEYEAKVKRGAILYVGANVTSKENISASKPAVITIKIYLDNQLIQERKGILYAMNEYIYGAKEQNTDFYIYTDH